MIKPLLCTVSCLCRDLRKREDELRKVEELKPRMENELKSLSERCVNKCQ
jgi:hypothetical protein